MMRVSTLIYKAAALVLVAAAFALVAVAGYAGLRAKRGAPSTSSTSPHTQRTRPSEGVEAELVTIRPSRFEPSQITRPRGPFVLAIANRSGLEEIALSLDRVAGSRLREMNVSRNKPNWRDLLDLQPGRYILTEANHPDWTCEITIAAER